MGKVIIRPTTYGGVLFFARIFHAKREMFRLGRVEWCAWYSCLAQACLILENEKKDSLG